MKPAIFLDRDGVLCKEKNFFYNGKPLIFPEEFEWEEGSKESLGILAKSKFYIMIVTNQSAIEKNILTMDMFHEINSPLYKEIENNGGKFEGVYICPHKKETNCLCRKPLIGMIEKVIKDKKVDIENSYLVGDKTSDILFGKNLGCKTVLVKTGYGGLDKIYNVKADFIFENLYFFSKYLEKRE
jgi:D-glycero-D-manno-heptose 1,7-bisphosphate phosphatase